MWEADRGSVEGTFFSAKPKIELLLTSVMLGAGYRAHAPREAVKTKPELNARAKAYPGAFETSSLPVDYYLNLRTYEKQARRDVTRSRPRGARTHVRKTHPGRRDHDVAAAAPRTLPKTTTRGVSKVEAPLARPRAVGRVKRQRRRRAGDPVTRRDAFSASPAHVELNNASTASSSSQYTPSEAIRVLQRACNNSGASCWY